MVFPQPVQKLGVLGDVHAEDQTLKAALDFLDEQKIVDIVCVGDVCTGRGNASLCCEMLDKRRIPTVCGNHDRWFLMDDMIGLDFFTRRSEMSGRAELFLERLPVTLEFESILGRCLLCHGLGTADMGGVSPGDNEWELHTNRDLQKLCATTSCRFVINGHTHRRMVMAVQNLTIINAGTLRRDHRPTLTVIDFLERVVLFYDIENHAVMKLTDRTRIP